VTAEPRGVAVPRRLLSVLAVGVTLALSGCGSETLSASDVASAAEDALEQEVGTRPDISCPDELPVEKGATTRCTLTAGDDDARYGVTVTVIGADDDPNIKVRVDDAPQK
jgi:hypothetical protein